MSTPGCTREDLLAEMDTYVFFTTRPGGEPGEFDYDPGAEPEHDGWYVCRSCGDSFATWAEALGHTVTGQALAAMLESARDRMAAALESARAVLDETGNSEKDEEK